MSGLVAIVRLRSDIGTSPKARRTMELLGLRSIFSCVIVKKDRLGMVQRCKDYVTFGDVDKQTMDMLKAKEGEVIRLKPPVGGLGPVRKQFKRGGALGYRGEEIKKLLSRMV